MHVQRALLFNKTSNDLREQSAHNGDIVKLNSRNVDMLATLDPQVRLKHQLAKLKGYGGRPEATYQWQKAAAFIQRSDVQFVFYVAFLVCFICLTVACRDAYEYFFSYDIRSTYITQGFDPDHNTWNDINRFSEFWEWTEYVLVPALFSGTGKPQYVDDPDEGWPNQSASKTGLLSYTIEELTDQSSYHDFEGLQFRQLRAKPQNATESGVEYSYTPPLVEDRMTGIMQDLEGKLDKEPYGLELCRRENNSSDTNVPKNSLPGNYTYQFERYKCDEGYRTIPWEKFQYYSAEAIGGLTDARQTAYSYSRTPYPGGGYVAVMVPFYSTTLLHDGEVFVGPAAKFPFQAMIDSGVVQKYYSEEAQYRCLRVSPNGIYVLEVCDGAPSQRKCKNLAYLFVRLLKQWHWLDWRTRFVQVTTQLKSPNANMDATLSMYAEFPGDGGILTSYKIDLAPNTEAQKNVIRFWRNTVCFFVAVQLLLEVLEAFRFAKSELGIRVYLQDFWNMLDVANLLLMIITILLLNKSILTEDTPASDDVFHKNTGYVSNARSNDDFQYARQFLAINTMLQYLKLIKFLTKIFPSMEIVTNVFKQAMVNIAYYSITIALSTFAAAMYMFVSLGDRIADFYNPRRAVLTILRSIFGDFDIDSVDGVTPSNTIGILYLTYLCIMTWIIISFFFSILGDAQEAVNERIKINAEVHGEKENPIFAQGQKIWESIIAQGQKIGEKMRKQHTILETIGANVEAAIDKLVDDNSGAEEEKKEMEKNEMVTREMVIAQIKQVKKSIENGLKPAEKIEDGDMNDNGVEDINEGKIVTSRHLIPMPEAAVKFKRFISGKWTQLVLYLLQLVFMTTLSSTVRAPSMIYFNRNIVELYINGGWNTEHEILIDVRTPADLYEWGINCLIPSLFSNTDGIEAWPDGLTSWPEPADAELCKEGGSPDDCEGEVWKFSELGATPYNVEELLEVFSTMHTEVQLQMVRAPRKSADANRGYFPNTHDGNFFERDSETEPYGYGFEGKEDTPEWQRQRFHWLSTHDLGFKNDDGFFSPKSESSRSYTLAGYHGFIMPFFSDVYLGPDNCTDADDDDTCTWQRSAKEGFSEECLLEAKCRQWLEARGLLAEGATPEEKEALTVRWVVTDSADYGRGLSPMKRRHGNYQCVRTSLNGIWVRQVCDPVSKASRKSIHGVVKEHVYDFWQELQDHHYIDFQTRCLVISLQVYSENAKLQSLAKLVFEFPLSGGITPSSLVLAARTDGTTNPEVGVWLYLSLTTFVVFMTFELLCFLDEGPLTYFSSPWNQLDILNFILFVVMYDQLSENYTSDDYNDTVTSGSPIIEKTMGFVERHTFFASFAGEWGAMEILALNLLLLFMKAIKMFQAIVPQCKQLIDVISFCFSRLLSLLVVINLTIYGFSLMFWVLLGSTMSGFSDKSRSFITMTRAALGDFDVASIDENSPDDTNLLLFLVGVTIIQFILLSMFFSILGEAQAIVIARNREASEKAEMEEHLAEAAEQPKIVEKGLEQQLSIGALRKSFIKFLLPKSTFMAEGKVRPSPLEEEVNETIEMPMDDPDVKQDLFQANSNDPDVIRKQMECLREELQVLFSVIEKRYLNEANPGCLPDEAIDALMHNI